MTPVLVSAPDAEVVSLDDVKRHLRVEHDDDNAQIAALILAAVGHLDGWTGILGRAIKPQIWREAFDGAGPYRLSMPNVTEVTVRADGETVTGSAVSLDAVGPVVALPDGVSSGETVIEYTCGLPDTLLPVAEAAVMLYVSHLYERTDLSPAFGALVSSLRWRGI